MKKSLLALAVVAVAASANAVTVYEKDGTSLQVNGRVQSVYYSNNFNSAGTNDSSIQNSARLGLAGKTQITDWVSGLGVALWDMDSNGRGEDGSTTAREQFVGADFGEFGVLTAGKFRDASYYAEAVTDNYEDCAGTVQGNFNGSRRGGQLMYTYDNYGFHGQFGVQTAQDDVKLFESDKSGRFNGNVAGGNRFNIDSGFSAALGYTFDDVVFGPLSLRTGYSYVKGQKDDDIKTNNTFDKFKHANAGISWGNLASGLYFGALYDYGKAEGISTPLAYAANNGFVDNELKIRGFELTGGYAFDNGLAFLIGYESAKYTLERPAQDDIDFKVKRIPVIVKYQANANFNVWAEAGFNAGSDHTPAGGNPAIAKKIDHQLFAVGARYTF